MTSIGRVFVNVFVFGLNQFGLIQLGQIAIVNFAPKGISIHLEMGIWNASKLYFQNNLIGPTPAD